MQDQLLKFQELQIQQMQQKEEQEKQATVGASSTVKLPKVEMLSYNGDKLKWKEFWDSFETTVYKNPNLSPKEKVNYLKSKLSGPA